MNGLMGRLYTISEWITRFAYVNLLWIGFTFLGLIVMGIFPSTAALFTVVRKWIMGHAGTPVFPTFWAAYKEAFLRSNVLGLFLFIMGSILYLDFLFIQMIDSSTLKWIYIPFLLISILYLFMLVYVIPVFVHYEVNVLQVIRNAFGIMLLHPLMAMAMVGVSIVVYWVMLALPGFIPFFSGSIWAFLMMKLAFLSFSKIERRREMMLESERNYDPITMR